MNTDTPNHAADQAIAHADRLLAARRSREMQGWSAQRLAQHAARLGCVAVVSHDANLPGRTRIEFQPAGGRA